MIINASYEGIWVEFERRNFTTLVFLLTNCPNVLKCFMTNPLYIIFDDFGLRLIGYMIEFSCLYIPQGFYCMSTSWL